MNTTSPSWSLHWKCRYLIASLAAVLAAPAAPAPPDLSAFRALSGSRPQECAAAAPAQGRDGLIRQCAWNERLSMTLVRQSSVLPASFAQPAEQCVGNEAAAWNRFGKIINRSLPVWKQGAASALVKIDTPEKHEIIVMWREDQSRLNAVQWEWQPSPNPDTRKWQAGHWSAITAAAEHYRETPQAGVQNAGQTKERGLYQAWNALVAGRPAMAGVNQWQWAEGGTCLAMQTEGISQAQLKLPYSRDDTRLEQRTAMQVQLERKIPGVTWRKPFTLIAPGPSGLRGGAKFLAVWSDKTQVYGQVWIPLAKSDEMQRARITARLPAGAGPGSDAAGATAKMVERELMKLTYAWERLYE